MRRGDFFSLGIGPYIAPGACILRPGSPRGGLVKAAGPLFLSGQRQTPLYMRFCYPADSRLPAPSHGPPRAEFRINHARRRAGPGGCHFTRASARPSPGRDGLSSLPQPQHGRPVGVGAPPQQATGARTCSVGWAAGHDSLHRTGLPRPSEWAAVDSPRQVRHGSSRGARRYKSMSSVVGRIRAPDQQMRASGPLLSSAS